MKKFAPAAILIAALAVVAYAVSVEVTSADQHGASTTTTNIAAAETAADYTGTAIAPEENAITGSIVAEEAAVTQGTDSNTNVAQAIESGHGASVTTEENGVQIDANYVAAANQEGTLTGESAGAVSLATEVTAPSFD